MILSRIKEYIDIKGISIAAFEKSIGAANASISKPIKNGGSIGSDKLENILSVYPDINPTWLMTGKGYMLNNPELHNKNVSQDVPQNVHSLPYNDINIDQALSKVDHVDIKFPDLLDNEEPTSVPFYDLPVSAGSLGVLDFASSEIPAPKGYVQLSVFRGCEYVFPIIGISMEPIIYSGDWIGIKHIDNLSRSWDFVQTGVIYLIVTNEDRMIKFIEQASDNEDYIICSSPNYKSFKVFKGDIINIYRVKAFARGL